MLEIANGNVSCILREVPYHLEDAIHAQFANGLVDYAKYWATGILYDIITGEERILKLLKCAQEAGGLCDEKVWHSAAAKLGMKFTEREILAVHHEAMESKAESQYPQR